MKSMEKPQQVREALKKRDTSALSAMGKKGGDATAEKRRLERLQPFIRDAKRMEERQFEEGVAISPSGDVVPPDDLLEAGEHS